MDVTPILDPLNSAQRAAVTGDSPHALVIAGAGSGKTRVLVHRIAWLLEAQGVSPFAVLAVTFTNKAAWEMRGRIEAMLGRPIGGMWVGTFHGLAHRMLRANWQAAGLPQDFQIIDAEDQFRIVRRLLRERQLDEAHWPPRQTQWFINAQKEEGLRPDHVDDRDDPWRRQMIELFRAYETGCAAAGWVDFGELLLRSHELLRDDPSVRSRYQERFSHVLVDEFQDTNAIQYAWLRLVAGEASELFTVGDDDQSIYGWRGARIENIQKFTRDYPNASVYRLEQNYRSSGNILAAANALIANNRGRLGKELWTQGRRGEPLYLYTAFNEVDEARFVAARIQSWVAQGGRLDDAAVLYRVSAQSRVIEEALIEARVPYRIYGGMRFYERAEIKDVLAYLRLSQNRHDDAAFERVVNTPTRGVGARTLEALRADARERRCSLWDAASDAVLRGRLPARAKKAVAGFLAIVERIAGAAGLDVGIQCAIDESGLVGHYQKEGGEKGQSRIENLGELVTAARQFGHRLELDDARGAGEMTEFLAHAALEAGEAQGGEHEACAQLMTLHSAKGLEFPLVFLCGVEDGLFPHQRSCDDPAQLEEERRLCYVGLTRAKEVVYLTHSESRRLHGSEYRPIPSRFLRELPSELVSEVRLARNGEPFPRLGAAGGGRAASRRSGLSGSEPPAGLALGQRVAHAKFGEGVVLNYEGEGAHARVQVNFERAGSKWLVVAYAGLAAL